MTPPNATSATPTEYYAAYHQAAYAYPNYAYANPAASQQPQSGAPPSQTLSISKWSFVIIIIIFC